MHSLELQIIKCKDQGRISGSCIGLKAAYIIIPFEGKTTNDNGEPLFFIDVACTTLQC